MKKISISEVADLADVDRATARERLKGLDSEKDGKSITYQSRDALLAVFELNLDKIKAQQLRYETARANRIEIQNAKLRGELVAIEDVAEVVEAEYGAVKAALKALPYKCAGELAAINNPVEIKSRLEAMIEEILTELCAEEFKA
jgi:predicted transcriptional regulator